MASMSMLNNQRAIDLPMKFAWWLSENGNVFIESAKVDTGVAGLMEQPAYFAFGRKSFHK